MLRWPRAAAALRPNSTAWVAVLLVFCWIGTGLHLQEERAHAIAAARSHGANLARAFSESLLRAVREIDQTLLFVRGLRERDGPEVDLSAWIDRIDRLKPLAGRIIMTNRAGIATMTNLGPMMDSVDLSDRPHFRRFVEHPEDMLHIGVPLLGRITKVWSLQFVRMLRDPQGSFDGILEVSIPTTALIGFTAAVDIGARGAVAVVGLDGVLRARMTPAGADPITTPSPARNGTESPAVRRAMTEEEGFFRWTDPGDDVTRLENFRRVPGLPLVVSVGQSEDTVLAEYYQDLPRLTAIEAAISVLLMVLAIAAARERMRRSQSQTALERTLAAISQGIIMTDPQDCVVVLNRRAQELLGLPDRFGPGCKARDITCWQIAQREVTPDALAAQYPARAQAVYKRTRPNGTVLEVRTHVLHDGSTVWTYSDVTEWERTQLALEVAREAAEAATRARSQFLAVMSHEIRTPLNGILGVAELLHDTGLNPEQGSYLRTIRECGRHLLDLLNDVLDFSKIDNGAVEIDHAPFAPQAVLGTVHSMMAPQATERGLTLHVEAAASLPDRVFGDARLLRQVLLNLVGNAIKFTPAGEVNVRLDAVRIASGWRLEGIVRDTGIGIAADMMECLFREFTQIDGSFTRRFGGTGLGLAITRRLLEAMGGTITAESEPGVATIFRFDLMVGVAGYHKTAIAAAQTPYRRLRILVAEDNQVNRLVATRFLARQGHDVDAVEDGAKALEAVEKGSFDLVLMDVMMPVMDGLAATTAIRALPGPPGQVPVIGVTASTSRDDELSCREAGMNGFAPKPITPDRLADEIARVCGTSAAPSGPLPGSADAGDETVDHTALDALEDALGASTTREIVATFLADAPGRLDRMRTLAASGAAELLGREAHALAGSAGTIGLRALAAAARTLETEMSGSAADLPERLAPLEALAEAGLAGLAARVARPQANCEPAA